MTGTDPFATWSEDYKETQALHTAQLVRNFKQSEQKAARNLKEAHDYYKSEQWKADGVEIETLDRLINDLQQQADTTRSVRTQAETRLDDLLRSQRMMPSTPPLAERRGVLIRRAPPLDTQPQSVEPTPLELFLQTARKVEPAMKKSPKRKKNLSL
ncbi:MAG: hypothetical protein K2Y42_06550 [Hyphomicrobium sp.]|jgi:hypothetical protein|uniref:hypothetical protein n=1 Tax=Hyphomicrobium sp. TaxID=82 RepID=UPI0025C093DF|nr:hypothetical protein [Hyphomicrobium sp.]MBX9862398.1 hypothetical protein [Hyphomicrobium sp.]